MVLGLIVHHRHCIQRIHRSLDGGCLSAGSAMASYKGYPLQEKSIEGDGPEAESEAACFMDRFMCDRHMLYSMVFTDLTLFT